MTLVEALQKLDAMEDDYTNGIRELRGRVVAAFAASDDDIRLLALKYGCDAEYDLTLNCDLFDAIAESFGLQEKLSALDEASLANEGDEEEEEDDHGTTDIEFP